MQHLILLAVLLGDRPLRADRRGLFMLRWAAPASDVLIAIWIADAHRDGKRSIVRADEKLTALVELESAVEPFRASSFCKSERNSFAGGSITALDSGQRIAKRIHL